MTTQRRAEVLWWDDDFAAVTFDGRMWEPCRSMESNQDVETVRDIVPFQVPVTPRTFRINDREVDAVTLTDVQRYLGVR